MNLYILFLHFLYIAKHLFFKYELISMFALAFYAFYLAIVLDLFSLKKKGHVRGARLKNLEKSFFLKLKNKLKKPTINNTIHIGKVELPVQDEDKQNIVIGRPGSGKTTIFNDIIKVLIDRNEKAVIYDEKSSFIQKFYDPDKDLILNIADSRTLKWTLANEIQDQADLFSMGKSLIPDPPANLESHWNDTSRAIFMAVMRESLKNGQASNRTVFKTLSQSAEVLFNLLQSVNAPEAVHLANSKNASDVTSTLMRYVRWLDFAADGDFKIADYLNNPSQRFIFIANTKKIEVIQRPLLTLFIDFFSKIYLSLPDSRERRMYMLLDEFGTLEKMDSIVDMLITGRSKGLRVFLGTQAVGQIDSLYQENTRNTILNCCSNIVLLAQNDPVTAELCSKIIGSPEIWESSHQQGMAGEESEQKQKQLKNLVIPNEFQSMENLTAYVRILKDWSFTRIDRTDYPDKNEPYIANDALKFNFAESQESQENNVNNNIEIDEEI